MDEYVGCLYDVEAWTPDGRYELVKSHASYDEAIDAYDSYSTRSEEWCVDMTPSLVSIFD